MTTGGTFTEYPLPAGGTGPFSIVAGPDGALWFTFNTAGGPGINRIGRISTAGTITQFVSDGAISIIAGPDGALWFNSGTQLGRITTAGTVSYYSIPNPANGLAAGPDHAIWFTEPSVGRIGRLALP